MGVPLPDRQTRNQRDILSRAACGALSTAPQSISFFDQAAILRNLSFVIRKGVRLCNVRQPRSIEWNLSAIQSRHSFLPRLEKNENVY